jgi:Rps23 Pro-64 3,4-dihydroxylase Tpa1-like proline 4-hydroxylase
MGDMNVPIFEYFEEPAPHIIIDNFLPDRTARDLLKEWMELEPKFEQAWTTSDVHTFDGCDECTRLRNINRNFNRDNKVVYLDQEYQKDRTKSITLETMHHMVSTDLIIKAVKKFGNIFPLLEHTTNSQMILSRYGMCDFYGWHIDTIPGKWSERVLTVVYYANNEPAQFEGGELIFGGQEDDITKNKTVIPKHNRCVIFPSANYHAVNNVKVKDDKHENGRFSLNFWLGFDGGYRYR